MNDDPTSSHDPADGSLPPRLLAALKGLDAPPVNIPERLDASILGDAKLAYARRRRFRPVVRWITAGVSIAAAVAVFFILRASLFKPAVHLARGDINPTGKVDMLDAYMLARRLAAHEKIDAKWDVNGDGVIDQADVDWIASRAVQIDPPAPLPANTP